MTATTLGPLYVVETDSLRRANSPTTLCWRSSGVRMAASWLSWRWRLSTGALAGTLVCVGWRNGPRQYAAFYPSRVLLRDYLPYFDQGSAQSHRLWSPDGSAFVFAGTLANGESGIWLQPVDEAEAAPVSLGPGEFATWSPAGRR